MNPLNKHRTLTDRKLTQQEWERLYQKYEEIFKYHHHAFLHKILNIICGCCGAELGRDHGEKKDIILIIAQKDWS